MTLLCITKAVPGSIVSCMVETPLVEDRYIQDYIDLILMPISMVKRSLDMRIVKDSVKRYVACSSLVIWSFGQEVGYSLARMLVRSL